MESIIKSMIQTFKNLVRRSVTVLYPYDKILVPERGRGLPMLQIDPDTHSILCTGCGECVKICPVGVIRASSVSGEESKVKEFSIDISNCIFCGLCVQVCPEDALEMTYKYELGEADLSLFQYSLEDLVEHAKPKAREFWLG